MTRVAIFGGGMGGLAAAHELIDRGYAVDLYEKRGVYGGKARTYGVTGTGTEGRLDLPAEHGFRFFPGFYRHVPDTMARIPGAPGNGRTVADALLQCTMGEFLLPGKKATIFPVRFPRSWAEFRARLADLRNRGGLGFAPGELRHFAWVMFRLAISCRQRRMDEWERIAWWAYTGAETRSTAYQNLLARGLTRSLVAMRAENASTRTVGDIMLQMVYSTLTPGASSDRVLNGPTT
ncbi:MAG: NAD(P)-binding protein, partial [Gemmatimonadaceae bacterium]|nr:NAD(P)-binding protein [Gemmatimonadaceae bacterium]